MKKFLQKFNPFYWRKMYEEQQAVLNGVKKQLEFEQSNHSQCRENLDVANQQLVIFTEDNEGLKVALENYQDVCRALQRQLNVAVEKNKKWFEIFVGYAPNDFILLNKDLRGHSIQLVKEPAGRKDD